MADAAYFSCFNWLETGVTAIRPLPKGKRRGETPLRPNEGLRPKAWMIGQRWK